AYAVKRIEIIGMGANDSRAAVVDQVFKVIRDQPVIDWHQHCADLRNGIVCLEMSVRIRRDVRDAIAFSDSHRLQYRRPAIATLEELAIREPQLSVDHSFA